MNALHHKVQIQVVQLETQQAFALWLD